MQNNTAILWLTVAAATCNLAAHADDSFRCGSGFTYREMSVAELLKKCGKPTSKTVVIEDVRSPGAKGKGSIVRGQTAVETWRYERGRQASAMLVKIVDGKIQSISAAP